MAGREKLLEQELRQAGGVVADDTVLLKKTVENYAIAELLEIREIDGHRLSALRGVCWRMARRWSARA